MSYIVEGVCWELRSAVMRSGISGHAAMMERRASYDGPIIPKRVIHAAIIVHGYVYEYSDDGIKKTKATAEGDPRSTCNVKKFLMRKELGKTDTTLRDFDHWIAAEMNGKFSKEEYCVSKNHCNHFAIVAAKFLSVAYLDEWMEMCEYTENNPGICVFAQKLTQSSRYLQWLNPVLPSLPNFMDDLL